MSSDPIRVNLEPQESVSKGNEQIISKEPTAIVEKSLGDSSKHGENLPENAERVEQEKNDLVMVREQLQEEPVIDSGNEHIVVTEQLPGDVSSLKHDIEALGLDAKEIQRAWDKSTRKKERTKIYTQNLETMYGVESARPQSIQTLHNEFSLKNFGRYPENMLVRQYDERDDHTLPYGVLLYPEGDHSGAFYQDRQTLAEFSDQLNGEGTPHYALRAFEIGGRNDLLAALQNAESRYKIHSDNKISFGVIAGHGNEDSIRFDTLDIQTLLRYLLQGKIPPFDQTLSKDDVNRRTMLGFKNFFHDWASIVLASCETGIPGGLLDTLKQIGPDNGKYLAPNTPVSFYKVDAHFGGTVPIELSTEKSVLRAYAPRTVINYAKRNDIRNKYYSKLQN